MTTEVKVVLLGLNLVGKTSLAVRFCNDSFFENNSPTIGASYFLKNISFGGHKIKLQLWDTAGQERYKSLAPMYYRGSKAAILVYDICSLNSFEKMKDWARELQCNLPLDQIVLAVVGNKTDLSNNRKVNSQLGVEFATSISASYFETSAKDDIGVQHLFVEVTKQVVSRGLLANNEMSSPSSSCTSLSSSLSSSSFSPFSTRSFSTESFDSFKMHSSQIKLVPQNNSNCC
eukprot:TRINITY_DN7502_c0_g1_i1.p1 TRINITY_DN7502_c0_g1~~TRINITY_DN7502_c0_g1_i1.p1  ORF type:complete len:231 (-),score=41.67 TRINITY_DN7502_c0_g1_i1:140-832(-)